MRANGRMAIVLAVLTLAAACGSTVAQRTTIASRDEGLGPESAPTDQVAASTSGPLGPGGTTRGISGAASLGGSSSAGASGTQPAKAGASASGHGYDEGHIYLGFNTINNIHTFAQAAGVHGLDFGDMKADAESAIAAINEQGGVLGRRLVGVYHDEDVTQATTNPAVNSQETCAALTQDRKVFAAVINDTAGDDNETFYGCMSKAGTPIFTSADWIFDQAKLDRYRGDLYTTQGPNWDVFAPVFLNRLAALKYFTPWNPTAGGPGTSSAKAGLLFPDTAEGRRVAATVARLAQVKGIAADTYLYADGTTQGIAAWESSIQASVLRFRGNGVTHVIADASSVTVFAIAAEQQHYRPRYGVESLNELYNANQNVPQGQFNGAVGVGWSPVSDTSHVEGAAAASCLHDVQARGGQNYAGQGTPIYVALVICDAVRLIASALNASGVLSVSGLAKGLGQIGPRFQPASTFRSAYSVTRSDIVGAVRDIGYDAKCSCFAYLSSTLWPV